LPETGKEWADLMHGGVHPREERVKNILRLATLLAAGLFLWTPSPLAAKPAGARPAAAQPAAKSKKSKKSSKPKKGHKTTHPKNNKGKAK
jgi:hypothetical protein